jgi:hypothetical protein
MMVALHLCLFWPVVSIAFVYPLNDAQIREAYFLGRTTDSVKLVGFFRKYTHHFSLPNKGPYVAEIAFHTPYERVVERAWKGLTQSAQAAERDYAAQPDVVMVTVRIFRTNTFPRFLKDPPDTEEYPPQQPEASWNGFVFRVLQERPMRPAKVSSRSISRRYANTGWGGAEVLLELQAAQFAQKETKVKVTTPEGKTFDAEFDLNTLR